MDIGLHFSVDGHSQRSVILPVQGSALAGELVNTILARDNLVDKMRA